MRSTHMHRNQLTVSLQGQEVTYSLRRSARKSVGLQINDQGLLVTAPLRLPQSTIEQSLQSKAHWIHTHLQKWHQSQNRLCSLGDTLVKGMDIPVMGEPYRLVYAPHLQRSSIQPGQRQLIINEAPLSDQSEAHHVQQVCLKVEKLLKPLALAVFKQSAEQLRGRCAVPQFTLHLSSARCRWGSCNKSNQIRLNWRLLHYPQPIIDYVVAHEMAHLLEMNHSPAFWAVVERILPNFQSAHRYLANMHPDKVPLL